MPKPYSPEFRRDVVAVARKHEAPLNQIAKDLGISESCLANWLTDTIGIGETVLPVMPFSARGGLRGVRGRGRVRSPEYLRR